LNDERRFGLPSLHQQKDNSGRFESQS
jgi:hypothetical protein